ncbi:MAG: hypothetical protein ABIA02_03415 [Candidatus Falkowbacteria bacterium]
MNFLNKLTDFFIQYKKYFMIAGFTFIVFMLGYLLYLMFFKTTSVEPPITEPVATTTVGGLPIAPTGPSGVIVPDNILGGISGEDIPGLRASEVAKGGITKTTEINKVASFNPTLSSNGSDVQYYDKTDGKFYRVTKDGKISALTDKIFHEVENVTWSPSKNKAILEYPDGANIVYDFDNNKQMTLPAHWKDFEFSPSGKQIVMKSIGLDPNNRWLAIVNEDGTKTQKIESIGEKDATVYPSWSPNNQSIAMYTEGIDFDRQEVFFVGLNNENFKSTVIEGRGFQPKWAPEGDKLLYSVYSSDNDLKPNLWIVNAQGESIGSGRKSLNVETWAEKCAFSDGANIYCAVPEKLEEGAGLFPEMAKNTSDRLYKIDTRTGMKKLVAVPDGEYNMSNIIVSEDGSNLYFTDETTGRLHKIRLK